MSDILECFGGVLAAYVEEDFFAASSSCAVGYQRDEFPSGVVAPPVPLAHHSRCGKLRNARS